MSPNEWDEPADADPRLTRAAEQLADATPVDWPAGEPGANAETLAGLRVLEALAVAHRVASAAADAELAGAAPGAPALFRWGGLDVLEKLGRGSFGEVFRAFDPTLGRNVALKLRHADAGIASGTARWIEEARRLARVRHPNVLTVYGAGVFDGRAGLWSELVTGETLEQRLAREGPLGAREATAIALDLCAALAAVHAEGLVHGDVTMTNVMRASGDSGPAGSGRIVLMDFGNVHDAERDTAGAWSLGTPLASAPELLAGARPTPRSDLYALGVLVFRLLTARYPVEAPTLGELRACHARNERQSLRALRPDLPPELVLAVERALEPDPAQRFGDVGELERALGGAPATDRAERATERTSRGRQPWALAAGTLALASLAILLAVHPWRGAPVPAARPTGAAPSNAAPVVVAPGTDARPGAGASPTAPPAAAPLAIEASLFHGVGDAATPIGDGARLATGDHLYLEIQARDSINVYVLDEDRTGAVVVMFPVANVDLANPMAGGTRHRLPGRVGGRSFDWQVTSAGGRETFLIVASRRPLPVIERQVAALEHASPGHDVAYAALPAQALDDLRGVAGMAPAPDEPPPGDGSRLQALAWRLERAPRHDVWVRLIQVANPGP